MKIIDAFHLKLRSEKLRFSRTAPEDEDIAIPLPPQCAHWGTFPSGEGVRAAAREHDLLFMIRNS